MSVPLDLASPLSPRTCQSAPHDIQTIEGIPVPGIPADYIWTHSDGRETALCGKCCAIWRQDAESGRLYQPQRIRSIERGRVYVAAPGWDPDEPGAWTEIGYI